ncbi:MAG: hypothetical protein ABIS50_25790 [Luteolibacter sp.]|uniref:hypothetical protein n=1 Tax=Luteolibacter sp. TaxID=1962973 RepID=UPI0032672B1A
MESKPFRSLMALNVLSGLIALIFLVAGNFISNFKFSDTGPATSDFEERLATHVGQEYTKDMHCDLVKVIQSKDKTNTSLVAFLRSYGDLGLPLGSALFAVSVTSIVILVRVNSKTKAATRLSTETSRCGSSSLPSAIQNDNSHQ